MFSKTILGGKYVVSQLGEVFNMKSGRKLKTPKGVVTLYDENGKKTCYRLNRLVAENFIDNPNNYRYVLHRDDNHENCKAENLQWTNTYQKTNGCLVLFDITGSPVLFKNYADFSARTGETSNGTISKLLNGEIDNVGEYYSKAYMLRQIDKYFTREDRAKVKQYAKEMKT